LIIWSPEVVEETQRYVPKYTVSYTEPVSPATSSRCPNTTAVRAVLLARIIIVLSLVFAIKDAAYDASVVNCASKKSRPGQGSNFNMVEVAHNTPKLIVASE
jgi:hypothetical protein